MDPRILEAEHACRAALAGFRPEEWQDDIGGGNRAWWLETFTGHGEGLIKVLRKLLLQTTAEEGGCMTLPKSRKTIQWRKNRLYAYQVVAYGIAAKPPSNTTVVRHLCNNDRCINPEHLRIGTQRQNLSDQYRAKATKWADV